MDSSGGSPAVHLGASACRALLESSSDLVVAVDADGRIHYQSPAVERVLGYTPAELRALGPAELVHPEDLEVVRAAFRREIGAPTGTRGPTFRARHRDGSWRVVEPVALTALEDDALDGLIVQLRDLTDRTRADAELRRSEVLFRTAFADAPIGMALVGTDGRWLQVNRALCALVGYSEQELLELTFQDITHPDDLDMDLDHVHRLLRGEASSYQMEKRYLDRERRIVWIRLTATLVRDDAGEPLYFVAQIQDITEQRAAREALEHSEARFRSLLENSSDVITIVDPEGVTRYASPSVERVLGHLPSELQDRPLYEIVHPDDVPVVARALRDQLRHPSTPGTVTYRCRHRDGTWRVLESVGVNRLDDPAIAGVVVNSRDVTERKQAEEALHRSNESLRALIEAAPEAVIAIDVEGRVTQWNEAAERIFGWTEAEVLGRSLPMVPPEGMEEHARLREMVLERGEAFTGVEVMRRRKDGTVVPISLSTAPLRDTDGRLYGVISLSADISEQKEARQALRESEERFRALIEKASDLIYILDHRAHISYIGPSVQAILGFRPAEVVGRSAYGFLHPDDAATVRHLFSRDLRNPEAVGRQTRMEIRLRHRDGSWRVFEAVGTNRFEDPIIRGIIVNNRDITERAASELVLRRAKEAAEAANRSKSEFVSGMSHELRTPLNSVIGFTQVLRKNKAGNLREQDLAYLERIHANGLHLLGLINDILDLSKIEAGKMSVESAPVALETLVRETIEELRGNVRPDVELDVRMPARLAMLETDARKLKQILINLVGNALKFTEAGSVRVEVEAETDTGRPLRIDVVDTGVGIAANRLRAIFDAFEQGEGGTTRRYGGTGLGLAISTSLARLLGYRIEVRSEAGVGSTFSILLSPGSDERPEPQHARMGLDDVHPDYAGPVGEFEDKLILIIDDEPDSRFVLAEAVAEQGCQILTAPTGVQGIELARQIRPDLIMLDLMMPRMNGWDTLHALKTDPVLCEIPVVVVSVVAEESRGSLVGAVDLLQKPLERESLQTVLRRNLTRHPGRVLVVDDEEDARLLVATAIQSEGIEIRTAANGSEALRVMRGFAPDVIFLDLRMPGMDGVELVARLRAARPELHPAIVVVTGKEMSVEDSTRLRDKVTAVLRKDPDLEEALLRELREVWRRKG